jgi:hypothetical protein
MILLELCLPEVIEQDFLSFLYSESGRSSGVLPRKFGVLHCDAKGRRNWDSSGSKLGEGEVSSDRIMQYLLYCDVLPFIRIKLSIQHFYFYFHFITLRCKWST